MKRAFLALALLALAPLSAKAGAVYNCPRHGPRDSWQVERRGLSYVCLACEQEKAQKQRADADAARADRVARGEVFESDLRHLPRIEVNTRSFGSTNAFERRCLAAIRDRYIMVDGKPARRAEYQQTFKIVQSLGDGDYLARKGLEFFKLETNGGVFADDALVTVVGTLTGDVFDYTTVLGAAKRIRIFRTLSRQGHAVAEVSFVDALAHLGAGGTFAIMLPYDPHVRVTPGWNPAIEATITQRGGSIIHFGK